MMKKERIEAKKKGGLDMKQREGKPRARREIGEK
jgi:hypothetical protein